MEAWEKPLTEAIGQVNNVLKDVSGIIRPRQAEQEKEPERTDREKIAGQLKQIADGGIPDKYPVFSSTAKKKILTEAEKKGARELSQRISGQIKAGTDKMINRVGRGITPPPSHTTVRTLVYGGFKLIL